MTPDEQIVMIESFFNLEKPCPPAIKNCESIREDYKKRLELLNIQPGCTACKMRSLRNIFTTQIISNSQ